MNTTDLVHFPSLKTPELHAARRPPLAPSRYQLAAPVRSSIFRARNHLIHQQRLDGSWARPTTLDPASRAQLVLLDAFLDREQSAGDLLPDHEILGDQLPTGGWSLAPGESFDLDASVLAYFALKLLGESANQSEMIRARQAIRERGGADACGATVRLWLALWGQIDYEHCPPIAPESLIMPACTGWFSADDELRLAALSVAWTLRPRREVELARGVRELFIEQPQYWPKLTGYFAANTSATLTGLWSGCERLSFLPLRKRALSRANFLLSEAATETCCGAASIDLLAWQRIALHALGHTESGRVIAHCERRREQIVSAEADDARSHSETSLTSDTTLALEALVASGVGIDECPVAAGINWLATHRLGKNCKTKPIGEIAALLRVRACLREAGQTTNGILPPRIQLAVDDIAHWVGCEEDQLASDDLARIDELLPQASRRRQQPDGGWLLAEETNGDRRWRGVLRAGSRDSNRVSEPALTGQMLELLSRQDRESSALTIARAVAFLRSNQHGDGSWTCAGERPIENSAWAVRGLIATADCSAKTAIDAGLNWLLIHEQESGGWREPGDHSTLGTQSNAAGTGLLQSAAVILALVAAGHADHEATRRGIDYLIRQQQELDIWSDSHSSPDLDRAAWSLLALSRWAVAIERLAQDDQPPGLRLVCSDAL